MSIVNKILREATNEDANLKYIGDVRPEDYQIIGVCYTTRTGGDEYTSDWETEFDTYEDIPETIAEEIQSQISNNTCRCNHCNSKIKYAFIVKSKQGTIHVFGHTCGMNIQNLKGYSIANAKELNMKKRKKLKKEHEKQAILTQHPGLEDALKVNDKITRNIADAFNQYGKISEKQIDLVFKIQQKHKEWDAEKANYADVPEKIKDAVLTITSAKPVVVQGYGYAANETKWQLTLQSSEGWKIWGKVSTSYWDNKPEPAPGQTIIISCSIQKSDSDPKFGFFKNARVKV